jgi:hypothetical protein
MSKTLGIVLTVVAGIGWAGTLYYHHLLSEDQSRHPSVNKAPPDTPIIIADDSTGSRGQSEAASAGAAGATGSHTITFTHGSWTCTVQSRTCTADLLAGSDASEWLIVDINPDRLREGALFRSGGPAASVSGSVFSVQNCSLRSTMVVACASEYDIADLQIRDQDGGVHKPNLSGYELFAR